MIILTRRKYSMFEAASAFQKSIRRGDEDGALYWGTELFLSRLRKYAWKRLLLIVSEDIGLANPNLMPTVWTLYQAWLEVSKSSDKIEGKDDKDKGESIFFVQAVLLAVRSKKSRVVDHAYMKYFHDDPTKEKRELPDWMYDKHTPQGRKKGRGVQHFFDIATKLENMGEVAGEEEYKKDALEIMLRNEKNK